LVERLGGLARVTVAAWAVTCETAAKGMTTVRALAPEYGSPLAVYFITNFCVFFNLLDCHSHAFSTRSGPNPPDFLLAFNIVSVHFENDFLRAVKVLLNLEQTARESWHS